MAELLHSDYNSGQLPEKKYASSLHPMCAEIIEEFQKCHVEHPCAKFFGECTDLKIKLGRCFRLEKAVKRKANFEESKKLKDSMKTINPAWIKWNEEDQTRILWIQSTISESVISYVAGPTTPDDLEQRFAAISSTHIIQLRTKLSSIKQDIVLAERSKNVDNSEEAKAFAAFRAHRSFPQNNNFRSNSQFHSRPQFRSYHPSNYIICIFIS
ncbi:hypothetical protein C5167_016798 [Papaver somniferum]|nr:hypothetical protein C5167_016798 [Papaver somniferum]